MIAEKKTPKILLVEDDQILTMTLEFMLEDLGYDQVHHLVRGEEAVVWVRDHTPHLVLMDIQLEGAINGIEAARRIRAFSDVPIVFTTGNTDGPTHAQISDLSNVRMVGKPLIERTLRKLLDLGA